jgi:hypothetical protein
MNIKPSSTIRQDYNGFSKYCHELDEPVLLTRIMLQSKLLVAEKQIAEGAVLLDHDQVIDNLRRKINATKEQD